MFAAWKPLIVASVLANFDATLLFHAAPANDNIGDDG
jgi:hypothetical protein